MNEKQFKRSIALLNEIIDNGKDVSENDLESDFIIKGDLAIEIHSFLANNNLRWFK